MLKLRYARFILLKRSQYLKPHLRTKINHVPRHDDGREMPSSGNLLIFSHLG